CAIKFGTLKRREPDGLSSKGELRAVSSCLMSPTGADLELPSLDDFFEEGDVAPNHLYNTQPDGALLHNLVAELFRGIRGAPNYQDSIRSDFGDILENDRLNFRVAQALHGLDRRRISGR